RAASDILVPLLLAAFCAIVLNPLVTMLMRRGFRRGLASGLVITVIFCALVLLGAIIASSMSEVSDLYPQLRATMER
ncbi:AI-2E family transporter, partial [Pantoea agglomerans]|uniref:AI-2E family transporter n=1 Tax=Enterobacter agglomerans TaxID=549 RepID=UPI003C7C0DFE